MKMDLNYQDCQQTSRRWIVFISSRRSRGVTNANSIFYFHGLFRRFSPLSEEELINEREKGKTTAERLQFWIQKVITAYVWEDHND